MPSNLYLVGGYKASLAFKAPCRCATTANITLSGLQTIDGYTVALNDRVLVRSQTDSSENGIWLASSRTWVRAPDFDGTGDILRGTRIYVDDGSTYGGWEFIVVASSDSVSVGADDITFDTPAPSSAEATAAAAAAAAAAVSEANAAASEDSAATHDENAAAAAAAALVSEINAASSALQAATSASGASLITGSLPRLSRTGIKALNTGSITVAYLIETGREGMFVWRSGNYATVIAADTGEGMFLKADAVASTSGAWVRIYDGGKVDPRWFGAALDGTNTGTGTDDSGALQIMSNVISAIASTSMARLEFWIPYGKFAKITSGITIADGIPVRMDGLIVVSASASAGSTWVQCGTLAGYGATNGVTEYKLNVIRGTQSDWTNAADIGVRLIASAAKVMVGKIWGFTEGLKTTTPYSHVWLGDMRNNKYGLHACGELSGGFGAFTNQCQFYGGEFAINSGVNNNVARYGIKTSTNYTGINTLTFKGQSFELNKTGAGVADAIPYSLADISGSIFENQRAEVSDTTTFAKLTGACTTLNFDALIVDGGRPVIDDQSTSKLGNKIRPSIIDKRHMVMIHDVTNMISGLTKYNTDATSWHHPMLEAASNNGASPTPPSFGQQISLDGVDYTTGYVDLAGSNLLPGVRINTTYAKNFVLELDCQSTGSYNARMLAFGSDGVQLTTTGTIEPQASVSYSSGTYGGLFSASIPGSVGYFAFRVSTSCTTLFLGVTGDSIKGLRIYTMDGIPARVFHSNSHLDGARMASVVPSTDGFYVKGTRIWKLSPSSTASPGWVVGATGSLFSLSSVTATTTSGNPEVTLNTTTGLFVGCTITIAGVTGTKTVLGIKSGNVVRLDSNCDASVGPGAAVAFGTPTFLEMAVLI